ncbi:flocculation protein FLO11-like [Nicotiana sylvestris]|uniref:flocculation protein FLO11-like n=1 Tax=Nicotiana sylvestris TaxID=4096 RepID=UPI00388C672D
MACNYFVNIDPSTENSQKDQHMDVINSNSNTSTPANGAWKLVQFSKKSSLRRSTYTDDPLPVLPPVEPRGVGQSGKQGVISPNNLPFTSLTLTSLTNTKTTGSKLPSTPNSVLVNNKYHTLVDDSTENDTTLLNPITNNLQLSKTTQVPKHSVQSGQSSKPTPSQISNPITIHATRHDNLSHMQSMPQYPTTLSSPPHEKYSTTLPNPLPPPLNIEIPPSFQDIVAMQIGNNESSTTPIQSNSPSSCQSIQPSSTSIGFVPSPLKTSHIVSTNLTPPLSEFLIEDHVSLQLSQSSPPAKSSTKADHSKLTTQSQLSPTTSSDNGTKYDNLHGPNTTCTNSPSILARGRLAQPCIDLHHASKSPRSDDSNQSPKGLSTSSGGKDPIRDRPLYSLPLVHDAGTPSCTLPTSAPTHFILGSNTSSSQSNTYAILSSSYSKHPLDPTLLGSSTTHTSIETSNPPPLHQHRHRLPHRHGITM